MPFIGSAPAEDFYVHNVKSLVSVSRARAFSEAHLSSLCLLNSRETSKETTTGIPSPPGSDETNSKIHGSNNSKSGRYTSPSESGRYTSPSESGRYTSPSESEGTSPTPDTKNGSFLARVEIEQSDILTHANPALTHFSESIPFPFQSKSQAVIKSHSATNYTTQPSTKQRASSAGTRYQTPSPAFSDRFISNRNSAQSLSKTFQLSKSPKELSDIERLRRDASSTPDPFTSPSQGHNREGRLILFPTRRRHGGLGRSTSAGSALGSPTNVIGIKNRLASTGAVWNVGGNSASVPSSPVEGIPNGRGGLLSSGTNAPMYTSNFFVDDKPDQNHVHLEGRLAMALGIDRTTRLLNISQSAEIPRPEYSPVGRKRQVPNQEPRTKWVNGEWAREGSPSLLDAPHLRDDYYCSVLAYCHTSRTLAVGLSNRVYLWSETYGVEFPRIEATDGRRTYVSSLSFSSAEGGQSILAIGRNNGEISLWSLYDSDGTRFKCQQPSPVACVAFKPVATPRASQRFGSVVSTEELLVGDEAGNVYYYSLEWVNSQQSDVHGWPGAISLMAKICVHSQQICGLSWSHDGEFFATGANDNGCCLFDVKDILTPSNVRRAISLPHRKPLQDLVLTGFGTTSGPSKAWDLEAEGRGNSELPELQSLDEDVDPNERLDLHRSRDRSHNEVLYISEGRQKHKWIHSAAIKAIAFCPWQRGLIATGGGSNDRAIHFYHTFSGACLATIDVQAQVTSLIWSTGRREIAATFGYAQPSHPYRIAVFSWPECKQILAIPWDNDLRALLAIPYPGGPNKMSSKAGEGETWGSRTMDEGCIVVACSDESVKFHEVWSGKRKSTVGHMGLLGGSDILEGLEGIDKEGSEVIR